ncbi:MAG TPA: hypothetical protein DCZ91_00790 [Lachnospiraceae bacterium]|nr:hypothetical protein [Lachnospiraceae bacterium]
MCCILLCIREVQDMIEGSQPEEGDFDRIKDIISASVYTSVVDKGNVVRDIVLEEAGMYFEGDATLEQTVAKIQNRVSLYLKEK